MAEKKIDVVLMNDAVEMIKEEKRLSYNEGFTDGYKQAMSEMLKEQPHWTSVKERMPEKEGFYLVSAEHGNFIPWIAEMRIFMGVKGFCSPAAQPVVGAWMPLPDQYNAE